MSDEAAIREVISRIDAAWREKKFDGLESCFHPDAAIVGPGHVEYAAGRSRCAESYREFATNADVLDYAEEGHRLRLWDAVAVYTFQWRMTYRRDGGPAREQGTDQLVLQRGGEGWQVVWRYIFFQPGENAA